MADIIGGLTKNCEFIIAIAYIELALIKVTAQPLAFGAFSIGCFKVVLCVGGGVWWDKKARHRSLQDVAYDFRFYSTECMDLCFRNAVEYLVEKTIFFDFDMYVRFRIGFVQEYY